MFHMVCYPFSLHCLDLMQHKMYLLAKEKLKNEKLYKMCAIALVMANNFHGIWIILCNIATFFSVQSFCSFVKKIVLMGELGWYIKSSPGHPKDSQWGYRLNFMVAYPSIQILFHTS